MSRFRMLSITLLAACFAVGSVPAHAHAAPAYEGVGVHSLSHELWPDMERDLDAARDSGANVVRVDVSWYQLEPAGKGLFIGWYRDRIDAFMEAASERGLKVVAALWQSPCWAVDYRCAGSYNASLVTYPPANPADYGDIAAYIANRYKNSLAAIEVWNEPNNPGFFTSWNRPKAYAGMVRATYPKVKAAAPQVKVLAGALSTADAGFLRQLYGYGIRGYYDAISVHPYMVDTAVAPDLPYPQPLAQYTFGQGLKLIRDTQLAAADRTPVWATEFGWQTSTYRNTAPGAILSGVTEAIQAEFLGRALRMLNTSSYGLGFVEGAIVYSLRDTGTNLADVNQNFGILHYDFSPKPSFQVVRDAFTR
jgi:hypothetical protein